MRKIAVLAEELVASPGRMWSMELMCCSCSQHLYKRYRVSIRRITDVAADCFSSYSCFYSYCYRYSHAYTCYYYYYYYYYACYLHWNSRSCSYPYFLFSIIQIHISLIRQLPLRICLRFFAVHLGKWHYSLSKKATAAFCYILANSLVTNNPTTHRCYLFSDTGNIFK